MSDLAPAKLIKTTALFFLKKKLGNERTEGRGIDDDVDGLAVVEDGEFLHALDVRTLEAHASLVRELGVQPGEVCGRVDRYGRV